MADGFTEPYFAISESRVKEINKKAGYERQIHSEPAGGHSYGP